MPKFIKRTSNIATTADLHRFLDSLNTGHFSYLSLSFSILFFNVIQCDDVIQATICINNKIIKYFIHLTKDRMKENCTCNLILKKLFQILLLHEKKLAYNKEVASAD